MPRNLQPNNDASQANAIGIKDLKLIIKMVASKVNDIADKVDEVLETFEAKAGELEIGIQTGIQTLQAKVDDIYEKLRNVEESASNSRRLSSMIEETEGEMVLNKKRPRTSSTVPNALSAAVRKVVEDIGRGIIPVEEGKPTSFDYTETYSKGKTNREFRSIIVDYMTSNKDSRYASLNSVWTHLEDAIRSHFNTLKRKHKDTMKREEEQKEKAQKARRNQRILTKIVRRKKVRPRIMENAYYNRYHGEIWQAAIEEKAVHSEEFSEEESASDGETRTVLIRKKKKWRGQMLTAYIRLCDDMHDRSNSSKVRMKRQDEEGISDEEPSDLNKSKMRKWMFDQEWAARHPSFMEDVPSDDEVDEGGDSE